MMPSPKQTKKPSKPRKDLIVVPLGISLKCADALDVALSTFLDEYEDAGNQVQNFLTNLRTTVADVQS